MGAAVILVGVALMIIIHEGAHFVAAKAFGMKATEAFFGFGPTLWSIRRGETEYGVKLLPLGGYVKIIGMNPFEEVDPDDEARTYRGAPFWKKSVVVLAGIASHLVVAYLIFLAVAAVYGLPRLDDRGAPIPTTVIAGVAETLPDGSPTPAALAGVRPGDRIVEIEGRPVERWEDFTTVVAARPGGEVTLVVERDGARRTLQVELASIERPVIVDGEPLLADDGSPVTELVGFFGVSPEVETYRPGLLEAATTAAGDLAVAIRQSVVGLWQLVVNFGRVLGATIGLTSDEILEEVRPISPIGLARIAGPVERSLVLLALVNVFVAVLNIVPLYPLDGGHFAVALYEKLTGRAPDVRRLVPVAVVVFAFVISLGLIGVYLDIFKPLGR
ncbi:MAG TPA: RIP metalloprotease [Actinobacteria bacterium]|nr:RIP metalloprotease [Actinomycetota bacterium]